jgi:energy-coupling factor transporter ATP-binding protein EcfA2
LASRPAASAARKALAQAAGAVRDFVRNTREVQRFKSAESAINTRAASKKAGDLHAKHMTERYAKLVDDELRELCFQRPKPVLAQKTNKAKVEVTPLISAEMKHLSAERVFSEGERTAIALACFLAELRLGSDPSGLIFDDPVSSLDHNVREHVARRLVTAAKERQVIVFTHDLAFLADLREQAKIQEADSQFRTLTATEYDAGFVEEEEPFGARNVGKRIRFLKALLVAGESTAKKGDLQAFRGHAGEFYERLRSTWERFIEERLFGQVVRRLERHVMPGALGKVIYSREIAEQVQEGWRRCSTAIGAHDHAPAAGENAHSVEGMKQDLQRLLDADLAADKASGSSK